MEAKEKEKMLTEDFCELIRFHYLNCKEYKNMLDLLKYDVGKEAILAEETLVLQSMLSAMF